MRPRLLIAGYDPGEAASISRALAGSPPQPTKVTVVSTLAEVLGVIDREPVYEILATYRHGRPGVREARAVVKGARGIPLVWLPDDGDVVEVAEAVAVEVTGAFYRDQLGLDLLRPFRRLAPAACRVWNQGRQALPAGRRHLT